jgi:quercetin dioxygenase-like cupin family protein
MSAKKSVLLIAIGILVGAALTLLAQRQQQTQRVPQFENKYVKVWKTIITPNQPLSMHRHEHGRTIVALAGGTLTVKKQNGQSYKMTWETGRAYWLDPDTPGELHGDVNETNKPIEVMVIEQQ